MNEKICNELPFRETVKTEAANIIKLQTKQDTILPETEYITLMEVEHECCLETKYSRCLLCISMRVTGNLKVSAPYHLAISTPDPTAYICPVLWVDR